MSSRWPPRIPSLGSGGGGPPPQIQDHFAPTIIVGNVPAGDPAIAQAAPFRYIPDPGDGTGIATGLAGLPVGGWLHIRRGTYTLSPAILPLSVAGVRVTGDGRSTLLVARPDDRRVFVMTNVAGRAPEVSHLSISLPEAIQGASGVALVDASASTEGRIQNVQVFSSTPGGDNPLESLLSIYRLGTEARLLDSYGTITTRNAAAPVAIVRVSGTRVLVQGGDYQGSDDGLVIDDQGSAIVSGNTFGAHASDAVRVEAGAATSLVVTNLLGGSPLNNLGGAEAAHNL